MTRLSAAATAAAGVGMAVSGLTWALGPWALFGSGLTLTLVALLAPVKERRGEPSDEPVPAPR